MSSLVDRFRSGAGKAAFEADKLKRTTEIKASIRSMRSGFEKALSQAGHVAFALHEEEQISQPELLEACERVAAIRDQISDKEQKIEQIQAEEYEPVVTVSGQERICPNGHGPLPAQDNFCQVCGAQAILTVPSPPQVQGPLCQHCSTPLTPGAGFCAGCGQPVVAPSPPTVVETAVRESCPSCAADLLPEALFCAECGYRLVQTQTPAVEEAVAKPLPADMELPIEEDLPAPDEIPLVEVDSPVLEFDEVEAFIPALEPEPADMEAVLFPEDQGVVDVDLEQETQSIEPSPAVESAAGTADHLETELIADELTEIEIDEEAGVPQVEGVELKEEMASDVGDKAATLPFDEAEELQSDAAVPGPISNACPNCNSLLLPDAIFCAECGHHLSPPENIPVDAPIIEPPQAKPAVCSNCQATLLADALFCAECGHRVG